MEAEIAKASEFVVTEDGERLHLRHFKASPDGPPILMLHGVIENGTIFYSRSDKGLAPFLARNGFDVFVGDYRGHGKSEPPINRGTTYGQTEEIRYDIPAFIRHVRRIHECPMHCIAHSWGGVLLIASLARFPELIEDVRSVTLFGTKRRILVKSTNKFVKINILWNTAARAIVALLGYLPRGTFGRGTDAESNKTHLHCKMWVGSDRWVDPDDGFDYGAAVRKVELPPILSFAGRGDAYLGHPRDVEVFLMEIGAARVRKEVLGRVEGHLEDYDHASMLTSKDAIHDHFPRVLDWLRMGADDVHAI
jgi:predicted alpha/beta hydrolase